MAICISILGQYTCQIDDERGVRTSGYLCVEGNSNKIIALKSLFFFHFLFLIEPQWRFETKLPSTLTADENNEIELECSVQDEDAECDWYYAGEVNSIVSASIGFSFLLYFCGFFFS